ncbi:thaumatin [Leptodontidium sp. 2 PMI_412]|nr:thaumatin [Leptodontidium sp. 2 PMI_412]
MCVFGQVTYFHHDQEAEDMRLGLNGTQGVLVQPGAIMQYGNIGIAPQNGAFHARWDCNDKCQNCTGIWKLFLDVFTLNEYAIGGKNVWDNLSNVNGHHINFHMSIPGTNCRERSCYITVEQLLSVCPKENQFSTAGEMTNTTLYGCRSMCKLTNTDERCCEGKYHDRGVCQKYSMWLKELCPDAYAWPHDDPTNVDFCYGAEARNPAVGPIA